MAFLSISELSNQKQISRKTIETALYRGKLKGIKAPDRTWLIEEKEADRYFSPPPAPEWVSFQKASAHWGIPLEKILQMRDYCDMETKSFKRETFVRTEELTPNLVATGFKLNNENIHYRKTPCFEGSLEVKQKRGLHARPCYYICDLCDKYFPRTRMELSYDGISWMYTPVRCIQDLLLLKVPRGGIVKIKSWGLFREEIVSELILASENGFYFKD